MRDRVRRAPSGPVVVQSAGLLRVVEVNTPGGGNGIILPPGSSATSEGAPILAEYAFALPDDLDRNGLALSLLVRADFFRYTGTGDYMGQVGIFIASSFHDNRLTQVEVETRWFGTATRGLNQGTVVLPKLLGAGQDEKRLTASRGPVRIVVTGGALEQTCSALARVEMQLMYGDPSVFAP